MRLAFSHSPNPMHVAQTAQHMARAAGQDRMAIAFQTVALVSMAMMGAAAAVKILRELRRDEHGHNR